MGNYVIALVCGMLGGFMWPGLGSCALRASYVQLEWFYAPWGCFMCPGIVYTIFVGVPLGVSH